MYFNKLGNQIFLDCLKGNLDMKRIENIIKEDETPLPAGYPRLWFCVYDSELHIMNLRRKILKSYPL